MLARCVTALLLLALICSTSTRELYAKKTHGNGAVTSTPPRYLFIFGDSYTSTGYNVSTQPPPSPDSPLGGPPYPGATVSGGENWVDVVVYNTSSTDILAYNFAIPGACVNQSRVQPSAVQTHTDMLAQQELFRGLNPAVQLTDENSLFISWFGINDVSSQDIQGHDVETAAQIVDDDIDDFFDVVDQQYAQGARNFMIILVPPIWRALELDDYGNTTTRIPVVKNLTQYWNDRMQQGSQDFQNQYDDVKSVVVDPAPTFNEILDHPTVYGAKNATCWNFDGVTCLWHDFIHPGIVINRAFGQYVGQIMQSEFNF